jgi:hypothetical protein
MKELKMSRQSNDCYVNGKLYTGYDYDNQNWVIGNKKINLLKATEAEIENLLIAAETNLELLKQIGATVTYQ